MPRGGGTASQHKSLEEREREYAEARKRILGNDAENETKQNGKSKMENTEDKISPSVPQFPKGPDGTTGFGRGRI
jgi:hypothetical protein